jgi:hypothetical protein
MNVTELTLNFNALGLGLGALGALGLGLGALGALGLGLGALGALGLGLGALGALGLPWCVPVVHTRISESNVGH